GAQRRSINCSDLDRPALQFDAICLLVYTTTDSMIMLCWQFASTAPILGCAGRRRDAVISQFCLPFAAAEVEEVVMSSYSARARQSRTAWWLRLASSSPYRPQYSIVDRERARRSDLIAWLALGMFGVVLIVSPIAIDDTQALLVYLGFVLAL